MRARCMAYEGLSAACKQRRAIDRKAAALLPGADLHTLLLQGARSQVSDGGRWGGVSVLPQPRLCRRAEPNEELTRS